MKTKTTIITLAALSLGVAATQAGRGTDLIAPGQDSIEQHASHALETFNYAGVWCVKITGYSYTLETQDASSPGKTITVTTNGTIEQDGVDQGQQLFDPLVIPQKNRGNTSYQVNVTESFDPPLILSGTDLEINYKWEHGASAFGSITLTGTAYNTPECEGELEAVSVATADSTPEIDLGVKILFTDDE